MKRQTKLTIRLILLAISYIILGIAVPIIAGIYIATWFGLIMFIAFAAINFSFHDSTKDPWWYKRG